MLKLQHNLLRAIRASALAALAGLCGITALTAGGGTASARPTIDAIEVTIRTGGDDLRGNDDNALIRVGYGVRWVDYVTYPVNTHARRLADYTETVVMIRPPEDREYTLADLHSFSLFVEGFTGGLDGDNWNVDAIQIVVYYTAANGAPGSMVVFNEFASPLIRFTGDMHKFQHTFRL